MFLTVGYGLTGRFVLFLLLATGGGALTHRLDGEGAASPERRRM